MKKKIGRTAVVLLLALSLFCPLAPAAQAAPAGSGTVAAAQLRTHTRRLHCGGDALGLLAEISGKSMSELNTRYPQKTAWQMAKAMGVLEPLKKSYLARGKVLIERMVESKSISAEDGEKLYADLSKRVSAIDGVNTVIPGRPGFVPESLRGRARRG